ncbi:amino acid ABC transporter permease [Desulfoluna spongiiphila]|uniref:amino acid ABC transporter permease n=1 Tax=Desulfoluna spongiiphila TaxID=419481 RepID=UPI001257D81F|nr:amino acid ABC transporter permease [Desulfoluna spongiiphila]VVS94170.1 amino acid abc transporter permease protein 3-tm domain [Desulfoluna spongiiphila]
MKAAHRRFPLFSSIPSWLLAALFFGCIATWHMVRSESYGVIFSALTRGLYTTLYVSLIAYAAATALGLLFGLMRISSNRVIREVATFYIEIVRGIPMLIILYYIAFVGAPSLVKGLNWVASPLIEAGLFDKISVRDISFVVRAILALTLGYSAFIAEIFRAGIESIPSGQMEAAIASGMSRRQAMQHVILPQAIRTVLPPLANDFVAMIKDSALVSALGVQDITQLGKVYSASTFQFFETYNVVALLYLALTLSLTLGVRVLEKRLDTSR